MEELINRFIQLSEEDKMNFMRSIMPSMCEQFMKNQEEWMAEIMPLCKEMMSANGMNMMKIMGMMNMHPK